MIIAMPVEGKSMDSKISDNFGRTEFYLLYDDKTDEATFLENTAAKSQSGAGIEAAQILVDNNIDVLITPRCGKNAADVLKSGNIEIYKSNTNSVKENLEDLKSDKLSKLIDIHPGFHKHGRR